MSVSELTSREAVLEAIAEYDQLGREAFLNKYGFDAARRYYVEENGKRYESKAIVGVAFGKQFPDRGPLRNTEFTGGVGTVGRKLKQLGFLFIDTLVESPGDQTFAQLLAEAMRKFDVSRRGPYEQDAEPIEMELAARRLRTMDSVRNRPHIKVEWSLGKGVWTRTPWIALLDTRITKSAQDGLYIVMLISNDLRRMYLTLNQGASALEKSQGRARARQILQRRAALYRSWPHDLVTDGFELDDDIDLSTEDYPSKFYQIGTIAHTDHDFPLLILDPDLNDQLEALLVAYEQLAAMDASGGIEAAKPSPAETGTAKCTNVILYGPPGTGKTFTTASRAVQLCDGSLPGGDRSAIMQRYAELRSSGRVEFVTFHQSFAYEDFVEGLRPETAADDEDEETPSGGFRLKPEPGVFKRIATVAEQSARKAQSPTGLDLAARKFFKMSLGRSADQNDVYQAAIEGGYIALGYGGEIDWSDAKYESWEAIFERWKEIEPDISPNRGDVVQTYTLRTAISVGDIVIIADGKSKFRAIGQVTGPYEYVPSAEYRHRRRVQWLRIFDKSLPVDLILNGRFSMMTLHSLNKANLKLDALQNLIGGQSSDAAPTGEPEPYVLIIDEINRANVSKVFGELITLLEPDKRVGCENELRVTLPYSKEDFGVPSNLHVIGTMNTADRSIALLDTALRRRFRFEELMPDPTKLSEASEATGLNLVNVLRNLNERIEYLFDREHQIGHAYFMPCRSRSDVDEVMRTKVIPLLAEYFYENWERVWQVLGEMEGAEEGAFLRRRKLKAPAGTESFAQDRWRFEVRSEFANTAYEQLT